MKKQGPPLKSNKQEQKVKKAAQVAAVAGIAGMELEEIPGWAAENYKSREGFEAITKALWVILQGLQGAK
ncbi:MAG: hypothetical protein GY757_40115 [bacterium]|nr:hypothetical protein [bacterium]